MDFNFLGEVLTPERTVSIKHQLLARLVGHLYSDRLESMPIACRINPMQQASELDAAWFVASSNVVVFMENYDIMILSTVEAVLRFLKTREPWQDFDVCIFDEELTWCAALTHNDEAKFVRLKTNVAKRNKVTR